MPRKTSAEKKAERRAQRLRRTELKVRRVEVALSANSGRDVHIADHLSELPDGMTISEFVRQAIIEKIGRETEASAEFERIIQERAAQEVPTVEYFNNGFRGLRDDIQELRADVMAALADRPVLEITRVTETARVYQERPPALPEETPGAVVSSGIDMSRDRPRPQARKVITQAQPEPEELSEADKVRLAKQMAESIRRAQPGRGG